MSSSYKAAVDMAAAILLTYREKYSDEAFPTIKGKLLPLIEARATKSGVDNIYVKRFKERMTPLVGQLRRIQESNGVYKPVEEHGVIYLCPSLELEWHRFIIIKEASHLLLDTPDDYVHSDTDIDNLLVCLAQFGSDTVTKQYVSEERAIVCAIELLFPRESREALRPRYAAAEISPTEIAKAARVPTEYVRLAMSDPYRAMIEPMYEGLERARVKSNIRLISGTA